MKKRMVIMLVAVAIVLGGIFGFQAFKAVMIKKFMSSMAQPPQTVTALKVANSEWQPNIEAVGSLRLHHGETRLRIAALCIEQDHVGNSTELVLAARQIERLRCRLQRRALGFERSGVEL